MARTPPKNLAKSSPKKKAVSVKSAASKKTRVPARKKALVVKAVASKKTKSPVEQKTVQKATGRKSKASLPFARKQSAPKSQTIQPSMSKAAPIGKDVDVKLPAKKTRVVRVPKIAGNTRILVKTPSEVQAVQPVRELFFQEVQGLLPAGYGDHFISLMICSPYQLYTYWEIQKHNEAKALQILGSGWDQVKSVLRVYNLTQDAKGSLFFDLELGGGAECWFIGVEPNQSYRVEIGLRHADGRFIMLARSNDVTTPRVTMSDILDEEWMGIDFDRMYALSGGFEPGCSSAALRRLMEHRLRSGDTSGSGAGMISSGSMVKKKDQNFWFTLNCELTVHGATAPDAQVTMNGQAVQLRPDGTFTLHYSLPDGKLRLEARAVSANLIEERTITPTVQRSTERPEPVIRRDRGRG